MIVLNELKSVANMCNTHCVFYIEIHVLYDIVYGIFLGIL